MTSSTTMMVPARKKAKVMVVVRDPRIEVGFKKMQTLTGRQEKHGVYKNVGSYFVDIQLTN